MREVVFEVREPKVASELVTRLMDLQVSVDRHPRSGHTDVFAYGPLVDLSAAIEGLDGVEVTSDTEAP